MQRIVIVGGGFGGIYTALALEKALRVREDLRVTLINRTNYFVYYPLMPEVISSGVEPRHVVVPLRTLFRRVRVLEAEVRALDESRREVLVYRDGMQARLPFDHLVLASGVEANLAAFPAVAEVAFPFKSAEDAIALHNQIVDAFEAADFSEEPAERRAQLTFVVVGGGATGVECLGEIEAYIEGIRRYYPRVDPREIRLVLVELAPRILAEVGARLGEYAADRLRRRGIELHLETSVTDADSSQVRLSNGALIPTRTLVWTIGTAPTAFTKSLDFPKDAKGYLKAEPTLEIEGHPGVWALGDAARIPDPDNRPYPPTAQHAVREARRLASNLLSTIDGRPLKPYVFHTYGTFVSIGAHDGVAVIRGRQVKGLLAWLAWRAVHFGLLPGAERKLRVLVDWLFSRSRRKDVVQIGLRRPASQLVVTPRVAFLREGLAVPSSSDAEPPLV
ncbi:MAG TPA: NAD(P)/FAD-dependent oxidoreductase [Pantanalinema sp.]